MRPLHGLGELQRRARRTPTLGLVVSATATPEFVVPSDSRRCAGPGAQTPESSNDARSREAMG